MIQFSPGTGAYVFYPRVAEPRTGLRDLRWIEPSGHGRVYATSFVRERAENGGDYNISLVELDEGPRVYTRVTGIDPEQVFIGQRVKAHVGEIGGKPTVLFTPAEDPR